MSTALKAAIALAAVSALALTACGPTEDGAAGPSGSGSASASASGSPSTSTSASASPSKSASAKPSKSASPATSPTPGSTDPDYDVFPCSTFDVTFTASLAEPTTSSYLLKITNKGTKACRALGHPVVTFGDLDGQATERGAAPGIDDAIRLEPGQSAYAGLMGGAKDGKGKTVNSIALTMSTESDLKQTPLKASTPGLYVSPDKNSVTAWMNNAEDALSL
ncbi:DUF4232 domain-containing protein [Streptomyces avidinii]|uniref:DUF4232 domain-containing protein n=1 Tax=Streptomyces avidinii TaxID=1895 RepID=A0ABS4KYN8_STRAV|nr:DUF4232 domain-containing protein [Streptomyces avidinii]MBP2034491.1 hypothetical protein [Streptomyces avidinii]GGY86646.1 hypothetical protein GCM10010343_09570 [Streptomyces avidinii]